MRAVDILRKKRDGLALDRGEDRGIRSRRHRRRLADYQAAAALDGDRPARHGGGGTAHLTRAMVQSGVRLDWSDMPGPKVDKHSTGGVGDKTSLILAPLAAACGCIVPMMSGRGLGHTGGTLDKLEAIPGFRVDLSLDEFRAAVKNVGCALVGQTREIAPADKILYALRDVTATVESIPLITASILSKKLAEGIDALVMDVKTGRGAFMKTQADARTLAQSLVATGHGNGVRTEALITAMDVPLGRAVGNALEVRECIDTLRGSGPPDVESLSVELAARMVHFGGRAQASLQECRDEGARCSVVRTRAREISPADHRCYQGGDSRVVDDVRRLPTAPHQISWCVRTGRGMSADIRAAFVGLGVDAAGGRAHDRVEDAVDPAGIGVMIRARVGEQVKAGDALAEVHYRSDVRLGRAIVLLEAEAWRIDDAAQPAATCPLIMEVHFMMEPGADQNDDKTQISEKPLGLDQRCQPPAARTPFSWRLGIGSLRLCSLH